MKEVAFQRGAGLYIVHQTENSTIDFAMIDYSISTRCCFLTVMYTVIVYIIHTVSYIESSSKVHRKFGLCKWCEPMKKKVGVRSSKRTNQGKIECVKRPKARK